MVSHIQHRSCLAFAGVFSLLSGPGWGQQPTYQLTDLGTLGGTASTAYGINSSGEVVGSSLTAGNAATHAYVYTQGTITDLGTLGGSTSEAFAINDNGQIVGYARTSGGADHATEWNGATIEDLGTAGAASGYAYGINNSGDIVGAVGDASNPPLTYMYCTGVTATVWSAGTATALPPFEPNAKSTAYQINDAGQVVGCVESLVNMTFYGATWINNTLTQLPASDGNAGAAFAINSAGLIAGQNKTAAMSAATVWNGTTTVFLRAMEPSIAFGINSFGQIVGNASFGGPIHAALWTSGGTAITDLNTLISAQDAAGNLLTTAVGINATGAIAANGTVVASGANHAYLLTPLAPLTVSISAAPTVITSGQSITLTWTSKNATSCTASGGAVGDGWTGTTRPTSGTAVIKESNSPASALTLTFTLTCDAPATSQSSQASVKVTENPAPANGGGGGGFEVWSLLALQLLLTARIFGRRFGRTV